MATEVLDSERSTVNTPNTQNVTPRDEKRKDRGKELWALLRNSVKLTTDLVKKSDVLPSTVSHGVHHLRKINHDEEILDVLYNPVAEEIVTLDNQFVRVFHKDGRRKDIVDLGESINKIIFTNHSQQYVGLWNNEEIKLFSSDLELVSTAKGQHKIHCMMYNESTSEVITSGPGNLTTWCFRYGNRYMIPHKIITEGLTCRDVFEKMALENTASRSQRCYAACGTAVAVFNLHEASLLAYKKDLHVRNITSLLFFNPLKHIITGSRDGSIKVWDEDFGIKLVFVGHHGPVTSLNLYPQV
uniref:WD repeat-containing protein KIAA1875-like n=1 Tax=Phallusia mammillata TaxID=59560 RepID=A0A6F9DFT5_9ASCI|nr:WD repeat-containing protein KIAA1875-like [Phallusia mammillata]